MKKVLVVEDEQTISRLMQIVLEGTDCEVRAIAKNVEDALLAATWADVDVAFVDYILGHDSITGKEVAKAGRKYRGKDVQIILLTALSPHFLPRDVLEVCDSYLQKPVDTKTLIKYTGC